MEVVYEVTTSSKTYSGARFNSEELAMDYAKYLKDHGCILVVLTKIVWDSPVHISDYITKII